MNNKFLIDSNSFISPYRQFYACDIVHSYWKELSKHIEKKEIVLLDMVRSELEEGGDALLDWISKRDFEICNHATKEVIDNYGTVMSYVKNCGYYNDKGFNSWAQIEVADPWLIAAAMAYGYTIVTFEIGSGNLNVKVKMGRVKIPDVATHFDVECVDLYEMMRRLKISL